MILLVPMRFTKWVVYLGLATTAALVPFLASYTDHRAQWLGMHRDQTARTEWNKLRFMPIQDQESLRRLIEQAPFANSPSSLSADQARKLREIIFNFFLTYHTGSFQAYTNFHAVGDYALDFNRVAALIDFKAAQGMIFPPDPVAKLERLWQAGFLTCSNGNSPRLVGLAPSTFRIHVALTNKPKSDVIERISPFPGAMTELTSHIFRYAETPKSIVNGEKDLLYAVVGGMVKSDTSRFMNWDRSDVTPLFVSFYWSPRTDAWLPWELVVKDQLAFQALF